MAPKVGVAKRMKLTLKFKPKAKAKAKAAAKAKAKAEAGIAVFPKAADVPKLPDLPPILPPTIKPPSLDLGDLDMDEEIGLHTGSAASSVASSEATPVAASSDAIPNPVKGTCCECNERCEVGVDGFLTDPKCPTSRRMRHNVCHTNRVKLNRFWNASGRRPEISKAKLAGMYSKARLDGLSTEELHLLAVETASEEIFSATTDSSRSEPLPLSVWLARGYTQTFIEHNHAGCQKARDGMTDLYIMETTSKETTTGSKETRKTTHTKKSDKEVAKALKVAAPKSVGPGLKGVALTEAEKQTLKVCRQVVTSLSPALVQLSAFPAEQTSAVLPLIKQGVAEANARLINPKLGPLPTGVEDSWKSWQQEAKALVSDLNRAALRARADGPQSDRGID